MTLLDYSASSNCPLEHPPQDSGKLRNLTLYRLNILRTSSWRPIELNNLIGLPNHSGLVTLLQSTHAPL